MQALPAQVSVRLIGQVAYKTQKDRKAVNKECFWDKKGSECLFHIPGKTECNVYTQDHAHALEDLRRFFAYTFVRHIDSMQVETDVYGNIISGLGLKQSSSSQSRLQTLKECCFCFLFFGFFFFSIFDFRYFTEPLSGNSLTTEMSEIPGFSYCNIQ